MGYSTDIFADQPHESCICAICHDVLKDASALNCGHTFCAGCIGDVLQSSARTGNPYTCPNCRMVVTTTKPNFVVRDIVDAMLARSSPSSSSNKKRRVSPNSQSFPSEFDVINKWPYLTYRYPFIMPEMKKTHLSCAVAYQCINSRGSIAHGRKPGMVYGNCTVNEKDAKNVLASISGVKELCDIDDIKNEIIKRGPVVSTSFSPSGAFLSNNRIGRSNHSHQSDILIVGWANMASGEVWVCRPLCIGNNHATPTTVFVAMGQFGIDDCCLAPKSSLDNITWQKGPYYDGNMKPGEEWLSGNQIRFYASSVDSLFKEIGTTNLLNSSTTVTVRDNEKKAHSRKATLDSIKWSSEKKSFKITFTFIE